MDNIEKLKELILNAKSIVFFGGAGVSTESGIPDFRGTKGLYKEKGEIPPEDIISRSYFYHDPQGFYTFYKEKMIDVNAMPNEAHLFLTHLEKIGKLKAIITQNIDGLHQKAGSHNVLELHGSVYRNYCLKCNRFYSIEKILQSEIPVCECGGLIKPDVTLYEETLPEGVFERSIEYIKNADLFIVGGTSLTVYPAGALIHYYKKEKPLVLINKEETGKEHLATVVIQDSIGRVFAELNKSGIK